MLGQILNELAQVERWLDGEMTGHESHDPNICVMADLHMAISECGGDTPQDDAAIVAFALICLLRKTQNPAQAGTLIVDKVRQLCASMARDRTETARRKARGEFLRGATNIDRAYNVPN